MEPPPPTLLRDRKKADTRQALFDAAIALVFEKGFRATTVADIAEKAGVSRRTFFRYFPSKEAAFNGNHEERLDELRSLLSRRPAEAPRLSWVRQACESASKYYEDNREFALAQFAVVSESTRLQAYDLQFDERWEEAIREALTEASTPDALPPDQASVIAGAILGMLRATLRRWLQTGGTENLAQVRATAFEHLERGLGNAQLSIQNPASDPRRRLA